MPNPIKYTTGTETLALKKGNFYIGTGDVGKGPSDVTGYYQGLSPSEGGYVIYMNREGAPGDLSYHVAANDSELITFTNNLAGQSYTTVNECLVYYAGQSDKVVLNRDYEGIVTDGLVLNLDAGFTPSYPKNGTSIYDISTNTYNGTLVNGPTFNPTNRSIVLDGTNDSILTNLNSEVGNLWSGDGNQFTVITWFKPSGNRGIICGAAGGIGSQTTFAKYMDSGNNLLVRIRGNTAGDTTIKTNLSTSLFHMGAYTWNGSIGYVYYNNENPQTANSGTYINQGYNFGIGDPTNGNLSNYPRFSGEFAISLIYNRALSADEVLQNYNAQKGRFGL